MKARKLTSILAGVALMAAVGAATADEPVKLTESQMDDVTAGWIIIYPFRSVASAVASAQAFGYRNASMTSTATVALPGASGAASASSSCSGWGC